MSNGSNIPILGVDEEHFRIKDEMFYVETDSEMDVIATHLDIQQPLAFCGSKGIGKSLAFGTFAQRNGIPIVQFDCSKGTRYSSLYGGFILIGEEVYFKPGVLPMSYMIANKVGKCILVLEELNALTPQVQKMLCSATDYRAGVYVQEIAQYFRCDEGNKLLIGATMNPSGYGGVSELNADLRSRFSILDFDYPTPMQEAEIMRCEDKELENNLIHLAKETRQGEKHESMDYAISPRDLAACVTLYNAYSKKFGEEVALRLMLQTGIIGKFEDDNKINIISTIDSKFGISLKTDEELTG